jgi:predicted DsbA family dithiol-disulfide isomerase
MSERISPARGVPLGVPYFIFGSVFAVKGVQAPDYLTDAIRRAAPDFATGQSAAEPAAPHILPS